MRIFNKLTPERAQQVLDAASDPVGSMTGVPLEDQPRRDVRVMYRVGLVLQAFGFMLGIGSLVALTLTRDPLFWWLAIGSLLGWPIGNNVQKAALIVDMHRRNTWLRDQMLSIYGPDGEAVLVSLELPQELYGWLLETMMEFPDSFDIASEQLGQLEMIGDDRSTQLNATQTALVEKAIRDVLVGFRDLRSRTPDELQAAILWAVVSNTDPDELKRLADERREAKKAKASEVDRLKRTREHLKNRVREASGTANLQQYASEIHRMDQEKAARREAALKNKTDNDEGDMP